MTSLVLIGTPKRLHIPYFAMPSSESTKSSWSYANKKHSALSEIIGGNASRWVIEQQKINDIRKIVTRNYIPQQVAFYADWLLFKDSVIAESFVSCFPQYQIEKKIARLEEKLSNIEETVAKKIKSKSFDLSLYPRDQNRFIVDKFINLDNDRRELMERISLFNTALITREEWSNKITKEIYNT